MATIDTPRSLPLSSIDTERYRRDGYLEWRKPVFRAEQFARLSAMFEDLLDRYGADDLDVIHAREPRLLEFLMADEVLDLVEPLVGPDIGIWSSHFISKEPRTGRVTPWHEDSAYWDGRLSTMDGIVTVWLAIDGADRANGSMGVYAGSHRRGGWSYEDVDIGDRIFNVQIRPDQLADAKPFYFTLAPGECSLHDARIVHGADVNRSERRRAGYTMRYFPTTSKLLPKNGEHPVWLARGRDRAGNQYVNG